MQTEQTLYVLKALAIISAAAAHCIGYTMPWAQKLSDLLGTIGVPVFFVLAGLFFKEHSLNFWGKKAKTLILPWLIWGMITYLVVHIADWTRPTIWQGVRWTMGCGTWLYFVPVLLACFVLFRICSADWWSYTLIVAWLFSNGLTIAGVAQGIGPFSVYQNVFNWVGFFAIGILLREKDMMQIVDSIRNWKYIIIALAVLVAVITLWYFKPSYWTPLSIIFELLYGVLLLYLSAVLYENKLLVAVGKNTYPIFFAHMQFGITITNRLVFDELLQHTELAEYAIVFLRPLGVVLFTYGLIVIGSKIVKAVGFGQWLWLLGINRA